MNTKHISQLTSDIGYFTYVDSRPQRRSSYANLSAEALALVVEVRARRYNLTKGISDAADKEKHMDRFSLDSITSDHLPIKATIPNRCMLVSYNVLNPKYATHIEKPFVVDGVDMSQRLSKPEFSTDAAAIAVRWACNADEICKWINEGYIVCLQEVCEQQIDRIKAEWDGYYKPDHKVDPILLKTGKDAIRRAATALVENTDRSGLELDPTLPSRDLFTNCNAIIFSPEHYVHISTEPVPVPEQYGLREVNFDVHHIRSVRKQLDPVGIINLHMQFGKGKSYGEAIAALFKDRQVVVAGDFNCSCRVPPVPGMLKLADCFGKREFSFVLQEGDNAISGVNRFENTKSVELMAERLDQIMLVNFIDPFLHNPMDIPGQREAAVAAMEDMISTPEKLRAATDRLGPVLSTFVQVNPLAAAGRVPAAESTLTAVETAAVATGRILK